METDNTTRNDYDDSIIEQYERNLLNYDCKYNNIMKLTTFEIYNIIDYIKEKTKIDTLNINDMVYTFGIPEANKYVYYKIHLVNNNYNFKNSGLITKSFYEKLSKYLNDGNYLHGQEILYFGDYKLYKKNITFDTDINKIERYIRTHNDFDDDEIINQMMN